MSFLGSHTNEVVGKISALTVSGDQTYLTAIEDPAHPGQFMLRVDTELTLDGSMIDNMEISSNGSPVASGNPLPVSVDAIDIAMGTGVDGPTVPRVTLATDVPLPAGTNAIGKLAANTGVDIGDVDVTSLPVGTQAMAASTPVTIATDDTVMSALSATASSILSATDELERVIAEEDAAVVPSGYQVMFESRSGDKTAMTADGDAVRPVTDEYGKIATAGLVWATRSNRVEEIAPINEKDVAEVLVDTTDLSADTYYYPSSNGFELSGFADFSVQATISGGVTMTIEADLDPDASGADWVDITKSGLQLSDNSTDNASIIDSTDILHFGRVNITRARIKSVTSDATNAVKYTLRRTVG